MIMDRIKCWMAALVAASFAALLMWGCGGSTDETDRIVLKAADDHELSYPTTQGLVRMGELLEEWTEGRITVEIYHSAQLGSEKGTIEQTQFGAIDINRVNLNPVSQIVPELKVFTMPYVFRDADHMRKVLDGEIGQEFLDKLEQADLIGLAYYDSGQRSFYNSTKPVRSIEDLKGMKIRVQQADVLIDMVSAVGGSPTPMAFEEVYTALQTGVIDGAENNFPSYVTKGHYEVAKYYTQDEHSRVPEIVLFSKLGWDGLTPEDQELIRKAATESVAYQRELWAAKVAESVKKAKEAGCEIITGISKEPFIEAMQEVYEKHVSDQMDVIERIHAVK